MNVNVEKIVTIPTEIVIKGITLLTAKEYNKYKENIPLLKEYWWLRSQGMTNCDVTGVYGNGSVSYDEYMVQYDSICVRPALKISNHNFKVKDEFIFKNYKWTVISEKMAICNTFIGYHPFREDWKAENANEYNVSDVKKYIEDWLYN